VKLCCENRFINPEEAKLIKRPVAYNLVVLASLKNDGE